MREQARRAGVQAATMTRLAKAIGLDGYEALRQSYADALRGERGGFLGKADAQPKQQKLKADHALAAEMLTAMGDQVARLAAPAALDSLVAAARRLARSRWVYCLGPPSSPPAAWPPHYLLPLTGPPTVLPDRRAATAANGRAPC